jgi:hypothetical protein
MIVGLLIGKDKSMGVPGKNVMQLLGRPMAEYGFQALTAAPSIESVFTSTDSTQIAEIGSRYGSAIISRPDYLCRSESLTEDVLTHALEAIEQTLDREIEILVLVFANQPAIDWRMIEEGIEILRNNTDLDSAFSVCEYNMFHPSRAKQINQDGFIEPFVPLDALGPVSSIRDAMKPVYFCDFSVQVCRRRCIAQIDEGQPPIKWMGKKSHPIHKEYGFDIDARWQIVVAEHWLRQHER